MRRAIHIVFRSLVAAFYRENAGFFVFLFTVMFCIVNKVDGAAVSEYHYSLIRGMLKSPVFLALVLGCWALYARKYTAYVATALRKPDFAFLQTFNTWKRRRRLSLFLFVEVCMLLPVLLYAACVIVIGCKLHFYQESLEVLLFLCLLCLLPALFHIRVLEQPERTIAAYKHRGFLRLRSYPFILLRSVYHSQKALWAGLKIFTCGIVYLVSRNNSAADYDTSFPFLFFNFGMMAHGVLIYRLSMFEEQQLFFYRSLPVNLRDRLLSYALLYALLLVPECIVLLWLTPERLHTGDALSFIGCGYALLMLMNSIRFIRGLTMKNFLKGMLLVFCIQFAFMFTAGLWCLAAVSAIVCISLFVSNYYRFESSVD